MKNLGKNIAFWKRYYLDMVLSILAAGLTALLCIGLRMSSYLNPLEAFSSLLVIVPVYWMLMGGIILMGMTGIFYKGAIPLSLSMGNTRKATICGMNLTYAAVCMTFILLTACLWVVSEVKNSEIMGILPIIAGAYLAESAVSIVAGIIYSFWGKWGILITVIVCGSLGAAMGIGLNMIEEQEMMIYELLLMLGNPWICFTIGLVFFAAAAFLNYFMHRKVEVRL